MSPRVILVKAVRDDDAGIWYVEYSDMPGLNLEAASIEELIDKLPAAVADLIECANDGLPYDVPIELIASASTRARTHEAA